MQKVTILGATGSIGVSTLDVIQGSSEEFTVYALVANTSVDKLYEQCLRFNPEYAVMKDEACASVLSERLRLNKVSCKTQVLSGQDAINSVSNDDGVDIVVAAIVGAVGLAPTLEAVKAGKKVLLANKESLVMAGSLFMDAVKASKAKLLPVDSEHNAIYQCLPSDFTGLGTAGIRRILLTGSGGPFRETSLSALANVTPDEACAHPNWSMGPKISVDSATMMNKGLEFIEACWLFNAKPEQVEVIVHPQSIVHSMVEYTDGSVLAQMGRPDMRTPIAHCLAWPKRMESGVESLDFTRMGDLSFFAPDLDKFKCLKLATEAMRLGGTAPTALNAANEVAVDAFLNGRISFLAIGETVENVMHSWDNTEPESLSAVIEADKLSRQHVARMLGM